MHRLAIGGLLVLSGACTRSDRDASKPGDQRDSVFAAVQERGAEVMGVDQYTSAHVFEPLPDGGRIVLQREVPGTAVMADRRAAIRYEADTLPRGGQVRIWTTDPVALGAVHEFLAFQRMDHRAAAHDSAASQH
jgi:hypothetical protein